MGDSISYTLSFLKFSRWVGKAYIFVNFITNNRIIPHNNSIAQRQMEKFHLCNTGIKAISIPVVRLSVPRSHSLLLLLFADCLANAGPIVVNILSMYTMRQTWCSSHVSHRCFYVDPSNSNCLMLGNAEARTCWVTRISLFIVCIKSQFTANKSLLYEKKETRQGWDKDTCSTPVFYV